jgi:hypothetical protein
MLISHKHKFIFIAIPKTATHAIRFALRPQMGENDLEQVSLFQNKKLPYEGISNLDHGHIKCTEIMPILGDTIWNTYFKFAIVRNPFDRFISYVAFIHRNNPQFKINPSPFLYNAIINKQTHKHILFKPQTDFIYNEKGKLMIDYVGRYENLQESYNYIANRLGIPSHTLEVVNTSIRNSYIDYFDEELKKFVLNFYRSDLENFNYLY